MSRRFAPLLAALCLGLLATSAAAQSSSVRTGDMEPPLRDRTLGDATRLAPEHQNREWAIDAGAGLPQNSDRGRTNIGGSSSVRTGNMEQPMRDETLGDSMTLEPDRPEPGTRAATGGAQTLDDILARQRGEDVPDTSRDSHSAAGAAAALVGQLRTRGTTSDAEIWSELRHNTADVQVSTHQAKDRVLVQDEGMEWLKFRAGPLREYGGFLLLGTLVALALFYLIVGRARLEGRWSGIRILRFTTVERIAHWTLAGSFILLALTGLVTLFGRVALIPLVGHDLFSPFATASKWIHNNVSWAFMLALVTVFVFWVAHNIPNRHDIVWIMKGGGLFSKKVHPPAKKFNAGQKIVFWSVVLLGSSISLTGLSLLLPFELPMFAKTFEIANDLGISGLFWDEPLPTALPPQAEMQLASIWHAGVAFLLMAIILGHIYIGTLGMEGAYEAMGEGEVDLQWAKEHHNLWVEELREKGELKDVRRPTHTVGPRSAATPAE